MAQSRECRHCGGWFDATREVHFYCSDTCRKASHKAQKQRDAKRKLARRLETKLKSLSASVFGRYLHKEILRAGTVQVLSGHNQDTLSLLAALRRRCTSEGGYLNGQPIGHFELSHIYPVKGKERVGLLHPSNLVICPKEFNRSNSRSVPVEGCQGLSIPTSELDPKWSVKDLSRAHDVLILCRKFLGEEFDKWLKTHQISVSQQTQLLKKLEAEGLPRKQLIGLRLEELKAIAEEEEIPHFSLNKDPTDAWCVIMNEYRRLLPNSVFIPEFCWLEELDMERFKCPSIEFVGSWGDLELFRSWMTEQALKQLHGHRFSQLWRGHQSKTYFKVVERQSPSSRPLHADDDIL